jgi:hypothetical protein
MDFVTLANEQHRLLRSLEQMLASDDTKQNNYSTSASTPATRPLFSKTAEDELFLLATNFLLYVAMVLVVIMVCKIYFPEMLRTRSSIEGYPIRSRTFNYRVKEGGKASEGGLIGDDGHIDESSDEDDDDEEEDDDEVLDSDSEGHNRRPLRSKATNDRDAVSNFLEFQQDTMPKSQVLKRLVLCSIMLTITFVSWGALQVR